MKPSLILSLMLVLPSSLWAWSVDGHRITCRIAERHLTDKARKAISELIGDRSISDREIAVWADLIRGQAAYGKKYPENQTWHYINLDVADANADPVKACVNDNCVMGAIERCKKVLKDQSADATDRKEALFFIVHFVGDLHQPLHCGSRNDDKGGNRVRITFLDEKPERPANLHSIWDDNLVRSVMAGLTWEDFATRLNDRIAEADQKKWLDAPLKDWIMESHQLVKKHAYLGIPTDWPLDGKPFPIDTDYVKQARPVVEAQLQKGGLRLAKVLNDVFAE